jgi:hypothetical protein
VDRRIVFFLISFLLISNFLTACSGPLHVEAAHVFDDVPDESTWGNAVQVLGYEGYVSGKDEHNFHPEAIMNRAEIAVLLLRGKYGPEFMPESRSEPWFECWVDQAVDEGLMSPVEDPTEPATRADVVTLMWLMSQ